MTVVVWFYRCRAVCIDDFAFFVERDDAARDIFEQCLVERSLDIISRDAFEVFASGDERRAMRVCRITARTGAVTRS